jgi:hypothetical protein
VRRSAGNQASGLSKIRTEIIFDINTERKETVNLSAEMESTKLHL